MHSHTLFSHLAKNMGLALSLLRYIFLSLPQFALIAKPLFSDILIFNMPMTTKLLFSTHFSCLPILSQDAQRSFLTSILFICPLILRTMSNPTSIWKHKSSDSKLLDIVITH